MDHDTTFGIRTLTKRPPWGRNLTGAIGRFLTGPDREYHYLRNRRKCALAAILAATGGRLKTLSKTFFSKDMQKDGFHCPLSIVIDYLLPEGMTVVRLIEGKLQKVTLYALG